MKKILIICNYFAPENAIASIRTTKFAKYLSNSGYQVDVITQKKHLEFIDPILAQDANGINVNYAKISGFVETIEKFYKKIIKKRRERLFNNLSDRFRINSISGQKEFYPFQTVHPIIASLDFLVDFLKQYSLLHNISFSFKKNINTYDYCFTSYGDYFGHLAGKYLKKKNPYLIWIADFRDPVYTYKFTPKYVGFIAKSFEKDVYKSCDLITVISDGMLNLIPSCYREKAKCITNGFDLSDRINIDVHHNYKFTFCYTGGMYGGLRNLSLIFQVVKMLSDEGIVNLTDVEFHYAGANSAFEIFKSQAAQYELQEKCIGHGKISRDNSLKLQNESTILMVSSWDYKSQTVGIITGKAIEYMSAGKPIIAIINGDLQENELAKIIRNANLGFAYEQTHHERDFEGLKRYIADKYSEYKLNGYVKHYPNQEELNKFDYRYLTKELIYVMNNLVSKP